MASTRFSRIRRGLAWLIGLYACATIALIILEPRIVYQQHNGPSDPAEAGLPQFTAKTLVVEGLPTITYWENIAPLSAPTLFYFHGNAGGLYLHTAAPAFLNKANFHVVAIEYPGYPGAEGKPTETTIIAQAIALWDAKTQKHSAHAPIIWGYSLGSGVATQLAEKRRPSALILEAPFTAVADRGAELFPLIPVRYIMTNTYRSRDHITSVKSPLFIMHGDADIVIPIHHGRDLFALANEPKTFREYVGFGHLDLAKSTAYDDALTFIRTSQR